MSGGVFPLLAIDAGNTRVKWGVDRAGGGAGWALRGAFDTVPSGPATAFAGLPPGLAVARVIASNVAGPAVAGAIRDALAGCGAPVDFITARGAQCGVTSRYRPAEVLGSDRWAALIAAHHELEAGVPKLVVMAGTALTVDALDAEGVFLGGIIVPGPAMMRRSLARGTAQLPEGAGDVEAFPRETLGAIASGAVDACCGAIERVRARLAASGGREPACVASGGAIAGLAAQLPFRLAINENLVLDGLRLIARDAAD